MPGTAPIVADQDGGLASLSLPVAPQAITPASLPSTAEVTVPNRLGLHARPSMAICECAKGFSDTSVCLTVISQPREGKPRSEADQIAGKRDAKSIMQLMMLAATQGTVIRIEAEGPQHIEALDAIKTVIENMSVSEGEE